MVGDPSLNLKVGELVEVKSAKEILATLSSDQATDKMPFMPEMLRYCGKRFRVYRSAHKTADTSELYTIRRMANAVHLELRCDGSAHGGCQAGCLIYWKECWLKRVPETESDSTVDAFPAEIRSDDFAVLSAATKQAQAEGMSCRYRCQATEVLNATTAVRRRERWDPRFYLRDLTSGNVTLVDFLRFGAFAMLNAFLRRWIGISFPRVEGRAGKDTPTGKLDLQVNEWVRVKSKRDIELTLNSQRRNRGMWFDVEMLQFCGKGPYRVFERVEKIINEKTGEMMEMKNPCIILDGVTCTGNYLTERMFSRRHEYIYWREIWLERVSAPESEPESARNSERRDEIERCEPATMEAKR